MAVRIQNLTDDAHQRHIVILNEQEVEVSLRFLSVVEGWFLDVTYAGRSAYGFKLALNTLHMQSQNFPFDFIVEDLSGRGVDPFRIDDFSENRCALYMLQADDMAEIRGQDVQV
jgi:hypothetical protein